MKKIYAIILITLFSAPLTADMANQLDALKINFEELKNELSGKQKPIQLLKPLFESSILSDTENFLNSLENDIIRQDIKKIIDALKKDNDNLEQLRTEIIKFMHKIMDKKITNYTKQDLEPILKIKNTILNNQNISYLNRLENDISNATENDKYKIEHILTNLLSFQRAFKDYLSDIPDIIQETLIKYKKNSNFSDLADQSIAEYFNNIIYKPLNEKIILWRNHVNDFRKELKKSSFGWEHH